MTTTTGNEDAMALTADTPPTSPPVYECVLSAREFDVIELMAEGLQNPAIAAKLGVSVDTVKTHSKHLYRKLRVNSRVHAVHIAHQLGILSATPPTT